MVPVTFPKLFLACGIGGMIGALAAGNLPGLACAAVIALVAWMNID